MPAELAHYYTAVEEYLAGERISEQKHEYLAGIVYAMAGTIAQHACIPFTNGHFSARESA